MFTTTTDWHFFFILLLIAQVTIFFSGNTVFAEDRYDEDYFDSRERVLETSYHGLIKENETFVEITPLIKIDETKICGFHIIKKGNREIPFQIELVNDLGILKAKKSLNCEKRKNYKFDIEAVFCDGSHSHSANVHIAVIDINEYSPTFLQPSYVTEVDEGRLYQEIIRVEATDKDCTPLFGDVCKYEILTNDQPFTIDNEGSIRNVEPLSHTISHNHILSVVAYDCAMKQSSPVMVNIRVRRVCEARLMGIPERIDYTANSMEMVSLFPKLHLELCDMQCKGEDMIIESSVQLKTKHISFGCDRDATKCNQKNKQLLDLLQKDTEWTKDLTYDEGNESIFHFDGTTGAIIPTTLVTHHDFATHPFSILTMFRHHSILSNDKHTKEHIICSADDHKMNRHHMALFVRNCRLILLLRKNFNEGDLNIFSPAEWRWKIPQVCDNEWHHYTVNIDLPKVDLYIDGVHFVTNIEDRHSNPEVIDDWPLHAAHGVNTTLTVGACYQGSENRLKHGFSGDISEIRLSMGRTLTIDEINCGTECSEHLIPPPENLMDIEQQIQTNSQLNEITIEGNNKSNIELLLQKIQYINTKKQPTIGRRNIELRTTVSCPNKKSIRLPTIDTYIMLIQQQHHQQQQSQLPQQQSQQPQQQTKEQPQIPILTMLNPGEDKDTQLNNNNKKVQLTEEQKPHILITGNTNHFVSYPDIKDGVHILAGINITVYSNGNIIKKSLQNLDSCSVTVFPSLNPDHEEITLDNDENLSPTFDIKTSINKDGVEMIGYDSIMNYLKVLKSLIYTNKKPAYYLNRVFKLSCALINGHFHSTEYTLILTVLHPKQTPTTSTSTVLTLAAAATSSVGAADVPPPISGTTGSVTTALPIIMQQQPQQQHDTNVFAHAMIHSHDIQEPQSKVHTIAQKGVTSASHSTMLIIVICTSFVLLICGVGIARLRNNNTNNYHNNNLLNKGNNNGGGCINGGGNDKLQTLQQQQLGNNKCGSSSTSNSNKLQQEQQQQQQQQQLDWDDSALTITINPMQQQGQLSDDSSDSENSDSDDDEVINGRYKNVSQLEWDNSTI